MTCPPTTTSSSSTSSLTRKLRLDASAQRGSRDNDYLTTATEAEVDALMDRFCERFSALPEPLMRPKHISSEGKVQLPLAAYQITVPSLIVSNRETLEAKLEFHLENELPPAEQVTGRPFAIGRDLTSTLPAMPYQVGLKMIVFDDPPVGITPERADALPRQLHDVDQVAAKFVDADDWAALGPYVRRRYVKEREYQQLPLQLLGAVYLTLHIPLRGDDLLAITVERGRV